ncbi:MAG: zf-HC2 domain-containing protein [Pseudomonadota bacterium]
MSCYPELTLSIYVDGELPEDEAAQVGQHLEGCAGCRALVADLRLECGLLHDSLEPEVRELVPSTATRPAGHLQRSSPWSWALLGVATVPLLVAAVLAALPALPPSLAWIQDLSLTGGLAMLLRGMSFALLQGDQMLTTIIGFTLTVASAFVVLSSAVARRHLVAAAGHTGVVLALLLLSTSALALEQRQSEERVEVAAGEQIHESMLLVARYVVVEGDVDGDVFAFARNVSVKGQIRGNLFTAAESVDIKGRIGGSLHAAAQAVNLEGQVDGGAYLAGQSIIVGAGARVGRDLLLGCEHVEMAGQVDGSMHFGANRVYLTGSVARNMTGHSEHVVLAANSRVGGDVTVTAPAEDGLEMTAGASLGGEKKVKVEPWSEQKRHPLLTAGYYLGLLLKIVGLLLIGLLVVALVPGAVPKLPVGPGPVLRSMGVGFVTLVATPVAIAFAAITVIGLPLAVLTAVIYGFGIFLSSLVVAYFAVRALLAPAPGQTTRLLGGTAVALCGILVLTEIPFVGAGLYFLVMILGLGSLVQHGYRAYQARHDPA